ncbi:MAG TPA: potassium channel protein [Desulfobulbaceae bacterium]|nr:potassium channel protein [Desulfobulbaceae bacterium]HHD63380.1 potassium channel protein [Desulfobulbaceae bacterium]
MRKFAIVLILFIVIIFGGTFGYMLLENTTFWDGMYLTIITIATVGYGDMVPIHPAGKVFTIFLVFAGAGLVMYTFGKITEVMVEGGLQKILERRKMDKKIARLHDHYIICGFGRIGDVICEILADAGRPFVVIERDEEVLKELDNLGYIAVAGEAAEDDILLAAGIERASGLIAVVSTDADNLFITLTARGLNPKLFILARSSGSRGTRTKLLRAGASKVISPYYIGARRMAQLILRPTVTDFIDLAMYAGELGLKLEEILVSENASFVNKNLMDTGIRKRHDVIVVAVKREGGEMLFNPKPDTMIMPGDIMIVLGESDHINALEGEA